MRRTSLTVSPRLLPCCTCCRLLPTAATYLLPHTTCCPTLLAATRATRYYPTRYYPTCCHRYCPAPPAATYWCHLLLPTAADTDEQLVRCSAAPTRAAIGTHLLPPAATCCCPPLPPPAAICHPLPYAPCCCHHLPPPATTCDYHHYHSCCYCHYNMKAKSLRMHPDFKHRTEDWGVYLSDIRRHSTDAAVTAVDKLCAKHWDSQWDASIESIKTSPDRWLDYRLWKRDTPNPRFPDFKDNDSIMEAAAVVFAVVLACCCGCLLLCLLAVGAACCCDCWPFRLLAVRSCCPACVLLCLLLCVW